MTLRLTIEPGHEEEVKQLLAGLPYVRVEKDPAESLSYILSEAAQELKAVQCGDKKSLTEEQFWDAVGS